MTGAMGAPVHVELAAGIWSKKIDTPTYSRFLKSLAPPPEVSARDHMPWGFSFCSLGPLSRMTERERQLQSFASHGKGKELAGDLSTPDCPLFCPSCPSLSVICRYHATRDVRLGRRGGSS